VTGVDPAELKKIDKEVKKEIDSAVEAAKAAPIPPDHWLWKNVYSAPENTSLRTVQGTFRTPDYDPEYKN
jgi:pyruvate dehydrogenase E1 component alpha subunit